MQSFLKFKNLVIDHLKKLKVKKETKPKEIQKIIQKLDPVDSTGFGNPRPMYSCNR